MKNLALGVGGLAVVVALCLQTETKAQQVAPRRTSAESAGVARPVIDRYCITCHNERVKTGNLILDRIDVTAPDANPAVWEKVVHKVRTGTMPPPNMPQPSSDERRALLTWLETSLDAAWARKPDPGRT